LTNDRPREERFVGSISRTRRNAEGIVAVQGDIVRREMAKQCEVTKDMLQVQVEQLRIQKNMERIPISETAKR